MLDFIYFKTAKRINNIFSPYITNRIVKRTALVKQTVSHLFLKFVVSCRRQGVKSAHSTFKVFYYFAVYFFL